MAQTITLEQFKAMTFQEQFAINYSVLSDKNVIELYEYCYNNPIPFPRTLDEARKKRKGHVSTMNRMGFKDNGQPL
jgi:hypothetical protein